VKHRSFHNPNVACAAERQGRAERWITYADDWDHLRSSLEQSGYSNVRIEAFDFAAWVNEAENEAAAMLVAVTAGGEANFKPPLWQRLKHHLFDLFDGSCAYCECRVLHISYGHVEHYRPKRKPQEAADHPGYFWLAYTPANLLPCCEACNGARAKATHFPVTGRRALSAAEIPDERPLLLNPYVPADDPRMHLEFLVPPNEQDRLSLVRGRSERGETSIAIYNLQREDLALYRRERQRRFVTDIKLAYLRGDLAKRNALVNAAATGTEECSAACLAALRGWIRELETDISDLRRQVG
jgi:uncharacterized protein (TIGR02646 family)